MKFSDMMGPDDEAAAVDAGVTTEAGAPAVPATVRTTPPAAETPVRLSGGRSPLEEAVAGLTRVADPPSPETPRAFGAPAGVPPLPPAPPAPPAVPDATAEVVADPDPATGPGSSESSEPAAPAPEGVAAVPTGGTIAAETVAEPPPSGTVTAGAEPAVEPAAPAERPRPAVAAAFATISTATVPEPAPPTVAEVARPAAPTAAAPDETDDELPALHDVMAELGPRTQTFDELTASAPPPDAASWLDGLGSIDDDLLPR